MRLVAIARGAIVVRARSSRRASRVALSRTMGTRCTSTADAAGGCPVDYTSVTVVRFIVGLTQKTVLLLVMGPVGGSTVTGIKASALIECEEQVATYWVA